MAGAAISGVVLDWLSAAGTLGEPCNRGCPIPTPTPLRLPPSIFHWGAHVLLLPGPRSAFFLGRDRMGIWHPTELGALGGSPSGHGGPSLATVALNR